MAEESVPIFQVSKYRWIILLLFCLYSAINFLQFLQYTIIANITAKYYDVDGIFVDLAGLIFMICFIVFCIPFNVIIEKYSLRTTSIISSGLTTCGTLIKLASVSRDRFYVVMIGQTVCAIGQVFMLSIPSKLASTWFGANEVSTACAIAILGTQIGVAAGSIFPSNLVKNSDDMDEIGEDFMTLNIINSSLTAAIFVLVVLFFRAKPLIPPTQSQADLNQIEKPSIKSMLKAMATNRNYVLIVLAVGSSNGMYTCFGIVIGEIYVYYFPGSESEIGIITALAVMAGGCLGSVVFGYILDKWHYFKATTFSIILGSAITYSFVALSLELTSQIATYFTIPLFGFFVASTLLVGFEFATEVMYPVPEAACCGVLNSFIYLFTVIYTLIIDALFGAEIYIPTHIGVVVVFILSSLVVFFIKPVLRRREANTRK